jgi:hypothetical protein
VFAKFMSKLLHHPQVKPLLSDEHFSVDGTLIEAWASQKSFRPKDESRISIQENWNILSHGSVLFEPQVQRIPIPLKILELGGGVKCCACTSLGLGDCVRSPEEYQQFAAECLRLSLVVTDSKSKAVLVQIAATCLRLAERRARLAVPATGANSFRLAAPL